MLANKSSLENSRYISHQNIYNIFLFILQIFTPQKKSVNNETGRWKGCAFCAGQKITKFPSSNSHKTERVSDCWTFQITMAWPAMCTLQVPQPISKPERGEGMDLGTGQWECGTEKLWKQGQFNSTSKLHTAVRHVNKCAVYDTRYTWSLSGYLWIESPKVTSKNLMYAGTGMVVTLHVSVLHGLTLLGNQL